MSSPQIIVSAVHEMDADGYSVAFDAFRDRIVDDLDEFEMETDHNGDPDPYWSKGTIDGYDVQIQYHSGRGAIVCEVIIDQCDPQKMQLTGVEDTFEAIDSALDPEFTLDVYYWYTGVDRPGGASR